MITDFFSEVLETHINQTFSSYQPVGGGCINNTARLETNGGFAFIKWNNAQEIDMFEKEAEGLFLMEANSDLRIPRVLGKGISDGNAYLLLDWIESGHTNSDFWQKFGNGLALMHQISSNHFGLDHDNYIGRLPQLNKRQKNWTDFFITERLEPQLNLAKQNQLIDNNTLLQFDHLFPKLENLIPIEHPALLHGDLWSGNFMTDEHNQPVLIDPAVYYGHRETEIAFTTLFGGFDLSFYDHYDAFFPLEPGFKDRIDIHNLYPLLVHVNLFGTSYLSGINETLKRFT